MSSYAIYNGKVVETEYAPRYNKRTTIKIISGECKGTQVAGINSDYICDENGKSLNSGEYLNWRER